ncbi:hypothetical protein I6J24_08955 [Corynebacterium kroppenstedtii]|uniref:hypothetical protein n=1 Tax=Corynebacterium pseudokroppenstedtii TaxID=2804917 RepID=UPI001950BC85|nr:hypothetical protein [Corynebacterium pseudokroppenstedtii]MDK7146815.1 hypothetical protein [Corynebacterium pseudokroppenstedtii]QRP14199.1 hypothetical protein I6J24_08955 [Corynebacterium kroppenstedtii]
MPEFPGHRKDDSDIRASSQRHPPLRYFTIAMYTTKAQTHTKNQDTGARHLGPNPPR